MSGDLARLWPALLASYALGSIPTAYLIVRWIKRVDVRSVGSGNVGATNATRAAGAKVGAVVFVFDLAKGLVAVTLIASWLGSVPSLAERWLCGLAAVAGHMFPFILGFRGGKGVATTIGTVFGVAPPAGAVMLACWVAVFAATRYVSVASIVAVASVPLAQAALGRPADAVGWSAALAVLVAVKHHANLRRLLDGTEHRWERKSH
jgi:glycerol-3-phosphate acyltransferase PlsY